MSDRQLIADLLSALEYHTEQTRPIEFSRVAIEAAREYLKTSAQPAQAGQVLTDEELLAMWAGGFLDQAGNFLTRRQAFIRAHQMGQVITRRPDGYQGDSLYSEDLW